MLTCSGSSIWLHHNGRLVETCAFVLDPCYLHASPEDPEVIVNCKNFLLRNRAVKYGEVDSLGEGSGTNFNSTL